MNIGNGYNAFRKETCGRNPIQKDMHKEQNEGGPWREHVWMTDYG